MTEEELAIAAMGELKVVEMGIIARTIAVNEAWARFMLSLEKPPQPGVSGTNRKPSRPTVQNYARTMFGGDWLVTHQGIGFTGYLEDGTATMVDGGQRLRGLIEAAIKKPDLEIVFLVVEGLPDDAMPVVDIGRRRSPGDIMTMAGETNVTALAATARLCVGYDRGLLLTAGFQRRGIITPLERLKFLAAHPSVRTAVVYGAKMHQLMIPSAASAFWFLATRAGEDEKDVNGFLDKVLHGNNMELFSAPLTLRNLLLNDRKLRRKWETDEQLGVIVKAYQKWRKGEPTQKLMLREDEKFPKF